MRRATKAALAALVAAWRLAMVPPFFVGVLVMWLAMFLARGPREAGILFDRLTY
ncbi:hypothetical protein [Achromobacter sp. NFACC18-2]|uniref:hypothetical protein n=1 Tax=Achromobacter sp. NFACC18-2 TaxID=1564112 RepID=UPI0008CCCE13|nr:hypothetical protein [Achromobacter sp. NFACC18-2]SEJ84873.1 hypothetical protein SAMN03159494_03562 [Achromobacter sp. NFACC18-2]